MKILDFARKLATELSYSHTLRCIGQKLEQLDLKSFEIKYQDEIYFVQAWHKGTSVSGDVKHRYTQDELKELEFEMRKRRRPIVRHANPLKLSQILRTAGHYVDHVGGQLIRVEWQRQSGKVQSITLQYEASEADRKESGDAPGTIEEVTVHVYKETKKARPIARPGS
jgi:hypothetical protein